MIRKKLTSSKRKSRLQLVKENRELTKEIEELENGVVMENEGMVDADFSDLKHGDFFFIDGEKYLRFDSAQAGNCIKMEEDGGFCYIREDVVQVESDTMMTEKLDLDSKADVWSELYNVMIKTNYLNSDSYSSVGSYKQQDTAKEQLEDTLEKEWAVDGYIEKLSHDKDMNIIKIEKL